MNSKYLISCFAKCPLTLLFLHEHHILELPEVVSCAPHPHSRLKLTGCLLTPSQFFQTRIRSCRKCEAMLQMSPQGNLSLSLQSSKEESTPGSIRSVSMGHECFHGIAPVVAGVRDPRFSSSCWSFALVRS